MLKTRKILLLLLLGMIAIIALFSNLKGTKAMEQVTQINENTISIDIANGAKYNNVKVEYIPSEEKTKFVAKTKTGSIIVKYAPQSQIKDGVTDLTTKAIIADMKTVEIPDELKVGAIEEKVVDQKARVFFFVWRWW